MTGFRWLHAKEWESELGGVRNACLQVLLWLLHVEPESPAKSTIHKELLQTENFKPPGSLVDCLILK